MRLPRFAIDNHQFTVIVVVLLVLAGFMAFLTMPRSEDPQISPAGSSVIVVLPGATPADMEELVVDPVEEVINELEDIKEIKSTAEDGLAVIQVEFLSGSNPDDKYSDVVQKVNSIRSNLPSEIVKFEIQKWSISDVNILQVALLSDSASYRSLEKEAERLQKAFEKIPGVKGAETLAFPKQQVRVAFDLQRGAMKNIALNRVLQAVQSSNANIPGGTVDVGRKRFNIETSGRYASLEDIRRTIIDGTDGKLVFLKDIADVSWSYEDESYRARVNGQRAVFVTVTQKPGTNIFILQEKLDQALSDFEKQLPRNMQVLLVFEQSRSVAARLNGFFQNLLQGLVLVGIIVLAAVGIRAAVIVMLAVPISILIGIAFLDLSGFGLQQMSITGLVIALGLLVDNAIVVTENITRYLRQGLSRKEAAVRGTAEIGWAVISSTVTTVLAFVPIIMMRNISGEFIRSMPVVVVLTLTASLLISLTLTPFLSSKFIVVTGNGSEGLVRKSLNRFISGAYRPLLKKALEHPKRVVATAGGVFAFSLLLFPIIGVSFFPKAEKPQFLINIETPEGTSLDRTDEVARYVEAVLSRRNDVEVWAANIGHGNPRIYYNVISQNEKSNYAQIFVNLKEYRAERFAGLIRELRAEFAAYPGAKIEVKEFEQGPPLEAPIAMRIIGDDLDVLKNIAGDVEGIFRNTPGTVNINNPLATSKADLQIHINRAKAAMYGVPLVEIDRTVRAAMAGLPVSTFRDHDGKQYDIVVRLPVEPNACIRDFDRIYVQSVPGHLVPLRQLASLQFKSSPLQISHYNLDRSVTLTADVLPRFSVDAVTQQIFARLQAYDWPKGYRVVVSGELENREESFGGMLQAMVIAMIGIFGVLVLQFRSYSQPVIVFAAIPLAIIGSLLALFITGHSFSFTAFVGLTSLVGIVVNNSIILVDFTNQLRQREKALVPALITAGETRFIPIILTTATTVGGLLPLTLIGGTVWAPMGWTIIGGLLTSTVLTLVVVPCLYHIFAART